MTAVLKIERRALLRRMTSAIQPAMQELSVRELALSHTVETQTDFEALRSWPGNSSEGAEFVCRKAVDERYDAAEVEFPHFDFNGVAQ